MVLMANKNFPQNPVELKVRTLNLVFYLGRNGSYLQD